MFVTISVSFFVHSYCCLFFCVFFFFFFNDTATTEIYTLSLHDALPISFTVPNSFARLPAVPNLPSTLRSEEHTSELQSRFDLVCRLLLEKKKKIQNVFLNQIKTPQQQYYANIKHVN